MKRWHWFSLALLAALFAVMLIAVPRLGGGADRAQAGSGTSLVLDMNPTNDGGPCNSVDTTFSETVAVPPATPTPHTVAVCLVGADSEPAGLQFSLVYNDLLNTCVPNTECTDNPDSTDPNCRDSNPDANTGLTKFSTPGLGSGYDCTSTGTNPPNCDTDSGTGAGHGVAFLSCLTTGTPTLNLGVASPIAEVTFQAIAGGTDTMTLDAVAIFSPSLQKVLGCPSGPGTCAGGTDTKSGPTPVAQPTPTTTSTPGPSPTPNCGRAGLPACTPTPKAWTMTPTAAPTETATPEAAPSGGGGGGGNPPPPPPPAGGAGPVVSAPSTGDGSGGVPWVTWLAISVMAGFGAISLVGGGLFLRRAGMRQ